MKQKIRLRLSLLLAILVLNQAILPGVLMALTSGPTQPEVQGFQPIGTSDMVNLFTGDFSYNIPLGEINGYPINLAYSADSRPEDEASWVGLGWSLNPGVINREVRGLPDDFKGDMITKNFNLRENYTVGGRFTANGTPEIFGLDIFGIQAGVGAYYNNYRGLGLNYNVGPTVAISKLNSSISLDFAFDTGTGVDFTISPNFGMGIDKLSENVNRSISFTTGFNSRQGLKNLSFGVKATHKEFATISSTHNVFGQAAAVTTKSFSGIREGTASGSISFGAFSYNPTSGLPFVNESGTFSLKLGPTVFGASGYTGFTGYSTTQTLLLKQQFQPAFGYMHHQDIITETGLMDYNNGPGSLHRNSPHLPIAFGTYDLFNVSGHGAAGQFRVSRTDVGVLRPGLTTNYSLAASTAPEIAGGNLFDLGTNFVPTESNSRKGEWFDRNYLRRALGFEGNENTKEAFFFSNPGGNPHPLTEAPLAHSMGGDLPVRADLEQRNPIAPIRAVSKLRATGFDLEAQTRVDEEIPLTPASEFVPSQRSKRNQIFSYLTNSEAAVAGLDTIIENFQDPISPISRTTRPGHHLSEITVTQADGRRYVYGIPAYNTDKQEVTFAVDLDAQSASSPQDAPRETAYDDSTDGNGNNIGDNSDQNSKGIDNFFDNTKTPEYAHSYLLTAILSDDYVDLTGNGISDDDLGEALKFKYRRAHDEFSWRIPFENASFQEGLKSEPRDDKASYIYGQKEIWYLHAIEGRTMEARFITCQRRDGLGVVDENGGGPDTSKPLEKLDRIDIFSKSELIKNASDPTPIKSIHFEYDYSLCSGVPNFANLPNCSDKAEPGNGKLTLKRVYFTYGKSDRGQLNAYQFDYHNNFNYDLEHINRWGLYQEPENTSDVPTRTFPYNHQNKTLAEAQAGAWNLNQITLPSGGVINVEYEPDTYAYVQDNRAGQMFPIAGFAKEVGGEIEDMLYDSDGDALQFLVIDNIQAVDRDDAITRYLTDVEQLYFKCLTNLTADGNNQEYISGYLDFNPETIVLAGSGASRQLYIPLNLMEAENIDEVHPITFAGIQLIRFERPDLAYPGYEFSADEEPTVLEILGFIREIGTVFRGFVRQSIRQNWAQTIDRSRSWVRLSNPTFMKYGGGTRVKSIRISDEWQINATNHSSEYGQQYFYETEAYVNNRVETISSGVAAYEPLVGGEENLMRNAVTFDEKRRLAPNNNYYSELPLGESLYPSPVVGYSKVRIENLDYGENVKSIGYTEHEFYTAKDFPIIEKIGQPEKKRQNPNPLFEVLGIYNKDELAMSQGISVEVNDMHGKEKAMYTYNGFGNLLQSTNYTYRTQTSSVSQGKVAEGGQMKLDNQVSLLKPNGDIVDGNLGYSVDLWHEMKSDGNESETQGVEANAVGIIWIIAPSAAPFPHPVLSKDISTLKTSMTTKFIQRFGILDEVTVMENGSTLTTKNLLFDSETGDILLTETQNEFDDKMFNLTYPAHWAYEGMGQAYQNIGAVVELGFGGAPPATGNAVYISTAGNEDDFFFPGDKVVVLNDELEDNKVFWIVDTPNGLLLSDRDGEPLLMPDLANNDRLTLKIIRSGYRNKAGTPIASVSSKTNPLDGDNGIDFVQNGEVVDASAITFGEDHLMHCEEVQMSPGTPMFMPKKVVNPYTTGLLGNWRPNQNFVYYSNRTNSTLNGPLNTSNSIRDIGTIPGFKPFWKYVDDTYRSSKDPEWTLSNTVTLYDQRGNELENQDALGLYSAAQFGYKENLAVALANNAAAREMAFDGFEDYSFENESQGTEPFRRVIFDQDGLAGSATIVNTAAHTGRYAMQIGPNENFQLHLQAGCLETGTGDSCTMNMLPNAIITGGSDTTPSCTNENYSYQGDRSIDDEDGTSLASYTWELYEQARDNNGNPLFDMNGNPILVLVDDGNWPKNAVNITHTFVNANFYSLKLTVEDNCAGQDSEEICTPTTFDNSDSRYINECCSCLPGLAPLESKQYLVSFWLADDASLDCGLIGDDFTATAAANFRSKIDNAEVTIDYFILPSGPVIEGWQRYEGILDLPERLQSTDIVFTNTASSNNVYIDDFRFHPFNSNMQSYVYDDSSLRLWAVLDENNYATFYEYDDEGLLVRVKRETEKGIMTVQESRTVLQPQ